jgi:hypothetical protein
VRVVSTEQHVSQGDEPTLDDLREALIAVCGTDYGSIKRIDSFDPFRSNDHVQMPTRRLRQCGTAGGIARTRPS